MCDPAPCVAKNRDPSAMCPRPSGGETLAVQSLVGVELALGTYPNQQHYTPCMRQPSAAGKEASTQAGRVRGKTCRWMGRWRIMGEID